MNRLELPWFDRWLKGIDTGIDQTSRRRCTCTSSAAGKWLDASRYPFAEATPTTVLPRRRQRARDRPAERRGGRRPDRVHGRDEPVRPPVRPVGRRRRSRSRQARRRPVRRRRPLAAGRPGRADLHDAAVRASDSVLAGPIDATLYASLDPARHVLRGDVEDIDAERHVDAAHGGRRSWARSARSTPADLAWAAAASRCCPTTRTRARRCTPVPTGQGHALRRRGVPDVREDRAGPPPAGDDHDLRHAAPRLHARPAAEPRRRRLPGAAQRGCGFVRRDPTAPAGAFTQTCSICVTAGQGLTSRSSFSVA